MQSIVQLGTCSVPRNHMRELIKKSKIKLMKIETVEQLGDIFTKALPRVQFEYLQKNLMGW
jgi:hypothetical protein